MENEVEKETVTKEVVEETNETVVEDNSRADRYEKDIIIPSNGYLGGPKKVTIRAMTTAEEKILYSSRDLSYLAKICKSCTVSPKNLDVHNLLPQDLLFMIFQIRELTYGAEYTQTVRCPHCGYVQDAKINITNFSYTLLDENISEKLFIELPMSKAQVHLKLLSQYEIDSIEDEAVTLFQEGKIAEPDSYAMVKKFAKMIESVSGMEFNNDMDKYSYVNKLHMRDFNVIRNRIDSVKYGLDNTMEITCKNPNCEKKVEVTGTICPEFFRPTE